jgi:hypothetical protein
MSIENIEEKDLFNEENIPESNWFKFEKVGDKVMGEVVEVFIKKSTDAMFADQRVFVLKQKDGSLINVGIKVTSDYLMGRTNMVATGDIVGFEFKKEIPPTKKGFKPAKSIEIYLRKGEPKSDAEKVFDELQ